LTTASAKHSQGNAIAESAVKKIKRAFMSAKSEDELVQAILAMHQTPVEIGRPTPAQLHFGRNVRDEIHDKILPAQVDWQEVRERKEQQKREEKKKYDRAARDLPELRIGQKVRVSWGKEWKSAVVLEKDPRPRSYRLKMEGSEKVVERNRVMIRTKHDDGSDEKGGKIDNHLFFQQEVPAWPLTTRLKIVPPPPDEPTNAPPPDNENSQESMPHRSSSLRHPTRILATLHPHR
jgi:hypothetical protein